MQQKQFENVAFISYKREDEMWAIWLQRKLEHYKLPPEIRKKYPNLDFLEDPRHVFKDTTDLSGGVLEKAIKVGLDSSKFLIVICSPRAAQSKWVCKEVEEFIDSGRAEFIIPFIIEGEPNSNESEKECFPIALKSLRGDRELLGININENGRDAAAVKVVARMFEQSFDSLWQRFKREEKKRKRNVFVVFILAIIVLLSIITYVLWANQQISSERDRANSANKHLQFAYLRITKQKSELQKANDSISKQKTILQKAFDNLSKTEFALVKTNANLAISNKNLREERLNVLKANKNILIQRSMEYGNLAYDYIEEGKIADAENLLHKIIPNDESQYVYTPEMERALRRYYNYFESAGIKLVENKELLGGFVREIPSYLKKYGFYSETDLLDEKNEIVFHQVKETLENNEFNNITAAENGKVFFASKNDSIYVWSVNHKCCIYKEFLQDSVIDIKPLDNNRICVLGKKFFSIYNYHKTFELESKTKILSINRLCNSVRKTKIPFYCDDFGNNVIYQVGDTCLIIQQIGTNKIIKKKNIDGTIEAIDVKRDELASIALTCTNVDGLNGLEILHYPSLVHLYHRKLYGYNTNKLTFSRSGYLCALINTEKKGVTQLNVWDVSRPIKRRNKYFNLSQTLSIDSTNIDIFGNIYFITDDCCIVYGKWNENSNLYELWLFDVLSNNSEKLLTSDNSYSIDAKLSVDNRYILFSHWEKGVWLYDKSKKQTKKISNSDFLSYRSISISPDGSTIAFRAFKRIGESTIVVYNTQNEETKQYSLKDGYRLELNYNGTRLMLSDINHILYDYKLSNLSYTKVSSPVGSFNIDNFGYSKSGKYLYQIYRAEKDDEENEKKYYIKVWTSDTHKVIMENVIENAKQLYFDDTNNYIYRHSLTDSEIISFKSLESLIEIFKKDKADK